MITQILQLSLLAIVVPIALYFTGNTFINLVSKTSIKIPRNLFFSIFWGSIIIVSLTAIIRTGFSSVFLLTIIPTAFIIYQKPEFEIISWRELRMQMVAVPLIFLFFTVLMIIAPYQSKVENDMPFYSKISEYLILNGIEDPYHYFNNSHLKEQGNSAYHYFELWFNGIMGWMLNSTFTFMMLLKQFTLPLFITYIIIGFTNFYKNRHRLSPYLILALLITSIILIDFSPPFELRFNHMGHITT